MPKAIWHDTIIAEAEAGSTQSVEGNVYFPLSSLKSEHFKDSATTSRCPWKGLANYYDVVVDGETNRDAAWTYREPSDAAKQIKDHVAFWHGVKVEG